MRDCSQTYRGVACGVQREVNQVLRRGELRHQIHRRMRQQQHAPQTTHLRHSGSVRERALHHSEEVATRQV